MVLRVKFLVACCSSCMYVNRVSLGSIVVPKINAVNNKVMAAKGGGMELPTACTA